MQPIRRKIHHALALVHAALEEPALESFREANDHVAELARQIDWKNLDAELRYDLEQLTTTLNLLRRLLQVGTWATSALTALASPWPPVARRWPDELPTRRS
jgi:hypothetical protein